MQSFEDQYLKLINDVILTGEVREDRTGVGTRSLFGTFLQSDLQEEFPLLLTRPVPWKTMLIELLWMISGDTSVRTLQDQGVKIWDQWADEHGQLGPVYGAQWRAWEARDGRLIDQLRNVIEEIKTNPSSRRLIVSAWNAGELHKMALPPCHVMFQFYVRRGAWLDCQMYQRSSDLCVGMPFNMAAYATLTTMIARECNLLPGKVRIVIGDAHVYENHLDQAREMIRRYDRKIPNTAELVYSPPRDGFFAARKEHFYMRGYEPYGAPIKWEVAV